MFGRIKTLVDERPERKRQIYLDAYKCRFKDRNSFIYCSHLYQLRKSDIVKEEEDIDGTFVVTFNTVDWLSLFKIERLFPENIKDRIPNHIPFDSVYIDTSKREAYYYDKIVENSTAELLIKLQENKVLKEDIISILPENNQFVAIVYKTVNIADKLMEERHFITEELEKNGVLWPTADDFFIR